jgi:hypothetical protein
VALTHNLLLIYEARLEREHGLSNTAEDQRRRQRSREQERLARQAERPISSLRAGVQRATQRSVKFVRWLRHALRENLAEACAAARLAQLYASLLRSSIDTDAISASARSIGYGVFPPSQGRGIAPKHPVIHLR